MEEIAQVSYMDFEVLYRPTFSLAFTEGLDCSVKRADGLKSALLSGEGLVAEFRGTGKLYIQTRNAESFASWLFHFYPSRKNRPR